MNADELAAMYAEDGLTPEEIEFAERIRLQTIRPVPDPDDEDADELAAISMEPADFDGGYGFDSYFSRAMRKDD